MARSAQNANRRSIRWILGLHVAVLMAGSVNAQEAMDCGSLSNAYGPFDYTNPTHFNEKLPIVERAHFDRGVEQLAGHQSKANGKAMLAADLDYTLRAFPNHHRALVSMMRYHLEMVPRGASRMRYSAECYFDRAIRNSPEDAMVRMIRGLYYYKKDRPEDALESYSKALELAPESAEVHYNMGLIYLELGEVDKALNHARVAYREGYPLPGLRRKLDRLGVWSPDPDGSSN